MVTNSNAVIVVGADTKCGAAIAEHMKASGYCVFTQSMPANQERMLPEEVKAFIDSSMEVCQAEKINLITVFQPRERKSFFETDSGDFISGVERNILWPMHAVHFLLPYMLKCKSGSIINVTDISAYGDAQNAVLGTTSAGLNGLTKLLALDYTDAGIRANSVVVRGCELEAQDGNISGTDIAELCEFIMTHEYIVGQNVVLSDGRPVI